MDKEKDTDTRKCKKVVEHQRYTGGKCVEALPVLDPMKRIIFCGLSSNSSFGAVECYQLRSLKHCQAGPQRLSQMDGNDTETARHSRITPNKTTEAMYDSGIHSLQTCQAAPDDQTDMTLNIQPHQRTEIVGATLLFAFFIFMCLVCLTV